MSDFESILIILACFKAMETTSFDGTLVWAISDFSKRRQEAVNGRTPSLYSPPFYTNRAGYKMCARIYLNGGN